VLDGKLAVSCNLKPAYAGSKIAGRALLSWPIDVSSVDAFSSAQCSGIEPRQIREEAAVAVLSMCRRYLELSWLQQKAFKQGVQPAVHRFVQLLRLTMDWQSGPQQGF